MVTDTLHAEAITSPLNNTEAVERIADSSMPSLEMTQDQKDRCPFFKYVPRDLEGNLKYRRHMLRDAASNPEVQAQIWTACSRDLLFYVNTFLYLFEPRDALEIPFLTYGFQDATLMSLADAIGNSDIVIEKSRDMGASWMCVTVMEWLWHFHGRQTFLLLSRKEDLVDKTGDPKSLFWKLDFLHKYQPAWLLPTDCTRMNMHKENMDTGASIDGESTNKFAGVADRRRAVMLDEFSKMDNQEVIFRGLRDVSRTRIFNFTPQGSANQAAKVARDSRFKTITLHWSYHPEKARGLYYVHEGGRIEIIDHAYWTAERKRDYQFRQQRPNNPRFFYRSPWYDEQCDRAAHPMEIAQELDIDYLGSAYQFFDQEVLGRIEREDIRPPYAIGELDFDRESLEPMGFDLKPGGCLKLWVNLASDGRPPKDRRYVIGADISMGTGASNSAISIMDRKTREKVAEYITPDMEPGEFGRLAVALAKWFAGNDPAESAFMIWESNGPGRLFEKAVLGSHFGNYYFRDQNDQDITRKKSRKPGWWKSAETGIKALGDLRRGMKDRTVVIRSIQTIDEARQYIFNTDQSVTHSNEKQNEDPSGARANHGDLIIADALAFMGLSEVSNKKTAAPAAKVGSFLYRRLKHREQRQTSENRWLMP